MKKKTISLLLAVLLCLSCLCLPALAAGESPYPEDLYLQQNRRGTCTLCAATMMLRARLYQEESDAALTLTENDVANSAWCSEGLIWTWSHTAGGYTMHVAHASVGGLTADALNAILAEHPEGIVLYCGHQPHAVFVTNFEDGVFYCADPATGEWTPLADSVLSYSGQDAILRSVTAYWYIDSITAA